jgi:hypothetical protein
MDVDVNAGNHGVSPQDCAFIAAATPRRIRVQGAGGGLARYERRTHHLHHDHVATRSRGNAIT